MVGRKTDAGPWQFPAKVALRGQYVRLAPLSADHHADLWAVAAPAPDSFAYLRYGPFDTPKALADLLADLAARTDQPFWAVLDHGGRALGWLSICDVSQADGAFEIGSIWFSPVLQGTRAGREAIFLLMCYGMDTYRYERLVWRCQVQNERSFQAANNLGFRHEGNWRRAAIVKGWQRDVAWFSILRDEWPACRSALAQWLSPANFDADGQQKARLQDLRD